jgi:hypothetical protein
MARWRPAGGWARREKRIGVWACRRVGDGGEEAYRRVGVGKDTNLRLVKGSDTKAEEGIVRSQKML